MLLIRNVPITLAIRNTGFVLMSLSELGFTQDGTITADNVMSTLATSPHWGPVPTERFSDVVSGLAAMPPMDNEVHLDATHVINEGTLIEHDRPQQQHYTNTVWVVQPKATSGPTPD